MAKACWLRIMIASAKPRISMTTPSRKYMMPIFLWSTLVIHSRHRYGHQPFAVTVISTPAMTAITANEVISGMGCPKGMADQESLPNMARVQVLPPVTTSRPAWAGASGSGPGPGGIASLATAWNRPGSMAP